jgi:UDP-2,4-diacetamido-2,4,6-trideoxy-beta-L-altropyranose hydrolase
MHITFRADASTQIGTGHIIRCLTLADALKELGAQCHFVCREHEGNLTELIKSKDYEVSMLPVPYPRTLDLCVAPERLTHAHWLGITQEQDARQTIAAMRRTLDPNPQEGVNAALVWNKKRPCEPNAAPSTDWLVVDHYALDSTWETLLAPYANKILVIDDLADRKHRCNILLDQNLGKTPAHYQNLIPENCALLLGPQYALLQPQYAELRPRTPPRQGAIKNILIYFGGSDQHDLTGMATHACLQLNRPDIQLNVVMGNSYPHPEKLQQLAYTHSNIRLHQNLPSLAPLMLQADLAIGAGGSTSWERCCLGLPAIIVTLAENQIPIAQELHQQKLARWLGNAESVSTPKIQKALGEILNNEDNLEAWSQHCFSVTQAQGAATLAGYMLLKKHTPLHARLANLADEKLLLDWANDPQTRQNSFNTAPITPEQHRQWFYQKLRYPEQSKIYILETESQLPVGQVRFDWQEKQQAWRVNYVLAPVARGNGLGSKVLRIALKKTTQETNGRIYGEVLVKNQISANIFRRLNFLETELNGHLIFMNK